MQVFVEELLLRLHLRPSFCPPPQARAKQLYSAGYRTLTHLANADPAVLSRTVENLYTKQAAMMVASAKVRVQGLGPLFLQSLQTSG